MSSFFQVATTSYIWPAGIWENCVKLESLVDEVSILFFETASCLNYSYKDIPHDLKNLDLKYHIHLPLDLPWEGGVESVFETVNILVEKTLFLEPTGFVFHPPCSKKLLSEFLEFWKKNIEFPLFIENTKECDLVFVWDILKNSYPWICMDVGHILKYEQYEILTLSKIWEKTKMVHIYAPSHTGHKSLKTLTSDQKTFFKNLLKKLAHLHNPLKVVIEVFSIKDLKESLDIFYRWIRNMF